VVVELERRKKWKRWRADEGMMEAAVFCQAFTGLWRFFTILPFTI